MDLLNLVVNEASIINTCFLCLNSGGDITNVYESNILIKALETDVPTKTSLKLIMQSLFPSHDFLTAQACGDCTRVITQMYLKIQKNLMKKELYLRVVDYLNKVILTRCNSSSEIEINLPIVEMSELKMTYPKTVYHIRASNNQMTQKVTAAVSECKKWIKNFKSNKLMTISHKIETHSKICHICGKYLNTSKALKTHFNCHQFKQCPYCLKILKSHAHFNKHVKNHKFLIKNVRKKVYFNCDHCEYRTLNKGDLRAHMNKIHLKVKPYICEVCSKSFHKRSNLAAHSLIHDKVNNVTCETCGERFSCKKTLINHYRLHKGERKYECDICKRQFVTLSRRNEHVKRNHGPSNEICLICGKTYTLKKDLNSHMKRTHQTQNSENLSLAI